MRYWMTLAAVAAAAIVTPARAEMGDAWFGAVRFDHLEYRAGEDTNLAAWDLEASYGSDDWKLALESEGEYAIRPDAFETLRQLPTLTGSGFALLAAAFALTSLGCLRRRRWGWVLATAFVAINVVSAVAGIFMEPSLENAIEPAIGVAILIWLASSPVRKNFS